jgi:hypothetical protein
MRERPERGIGRLVAVVLVASLVACAAPGTSPSTPAAGTDAASSSVVVSPSVVASESSAPTVAVSRCQDVELPDEPGLVPGSFAEVVTNDLVLRNAPRIADDSRILGGLNSPARVYVNAGPVMSNGYEWWAVIPEGGNADDIGWVAAAGKDGEEWLRAMPRREGTWTVIERRDVLGAVPAVGRAGTGADGRIYFLGGTDGAALEPQPLDQALAFDPTSCQWGELPALPVAHDGLHVAQTPDGVFHAVATAWVPPGEELPDTSLHLVFDPATRAWASRKPVPFRVADGAAVVSDGDGLLWAFSEGIHRYDEATDAWTAVSTPSTWAHGVDATTLQHDGSLALLFPGAGGIWRYDTGIGAASLIVQPRVGHYNARVAALDDGTLVVAGGYLAGSCTALEAPPPVPPSPKYGLIDAYSTATGGWLSIPPLRLRLRIADPVPVVVGGVLYVIGLEERWNSSGSDPFMEQADLVIARFTPPDATGDGHTAAPPAGGCGG